MAKPLDQRIEEAIRKQLEKHELRKVKGGMGEACGTEGIYIVAYEARDPAMIFVPDPCKRGRYCRVPRSFLFKGCVACGALPGQPCHNPRHGTSWSGQTGHADRGCTPPHGVKKRLDEDVKHEAALVVLGMLVQSGKAQVTIPHLPGCRKMHKKQAQCDCEQADREKLLNAAIRQLPHLIEERQI